jgi:hypothetical protein
MFDLFLNLRPGNEAVQSLHTPLKTLYEQYHVFKSKDSHLAMSVGIVLVIVACVLSDLLCRSDILIADSDSRGGAANRDHNHPSETAALVAGSASLLLFVASLAHRSFQTGPHGAAPANAARGCRRLCLAFAQSSSAGRLAKDGFIVALTLFTGLTTVVRVVHSDCADQYSRLYAGSGSADSCNSAADLAMESYAMCLFVVLLPQVFSKGASRTAVCFSW